MITLEGRAMSQLTLSGHLPLTREGKGFLLRILPFKWLMYKDRSDYTNGVFIVVFYPLTLGDLSLHGIKINDGRIEQ